MQTTTQKLTCVPLSASIKVMCLLLYMEDYQLGRWVQFSYVRRIAVITDYRIISESVSVRQSMWKLVLPLFKSLINLLISEGEHTLEVGVVLLMTNQCVTQLCWRSFCLSSCRVRTYCSFCGTKQQDMRKNNHKKYKIKGKHIDITMT